MFEVWTEIVCASCASVVCGEWTSGNINRRGLASEAKRKRAILRSGEWFCCQRCLDQRANELGK